MRKTLLIVLLLPLAACGPAADSACEPRALNILLTNDDGYDQPGIIALHRALVADGHYVIRVAPNRNYSGSSTSMTYQTFTAPQQSNEEFGGVYAVEGSPATTVILGATALFGPEAPVDLVVSGINNGENLGPAMVASGTVGAIVAALNLLEQPVPGIGVSTGRRSDESPGEDAAHQAIVADFVVRLIAASLCDEKSFIDSGQSLNINYPRLAPADIKGIRYARQGEARYIDFSFAETGDGDYEFQYRWMVPEHDVPNSDVILFGQGYITIVPLDGDYSAEPAFDADALSGIEP